MTVIFDFDGTIVDSAPAILATLQQVLAMHKIQPVCAVSRALIGPPLATTLATLTGISDQAALAGLTDSFKQIYDGPGLESTVLYEGMDAVIRQLALSGYRLLIATNKRRYPTERLLARFKLAGCFAGVHCLDTQSPPHADKAGMLTSLLQSESLTPQRSLYIGDTSHDEVAAAKAGVPFLAVAWGYGVGVQKVSAQAELVATPSALPAAVAGHFDRIRQ
jgi:phosphoglycolate phosphatase